MSSNNNHIISIHNYEEWFVLYMDNELSAAQKKEVEDFLLLHPHLQEELDLLLSTKLPDEAMVFSGKDELLSASMKMNTVDESLLLYVDKELPAAENRKVEERLSVDKDFRLQYELLQKTKLNAAEIIPYPHKKELYRHAERRIPAPVWMRIAAAVVVLLTGGYFFLLNDQNTTVVVPTDIAVIQKQTETKRLSIPESHAQKNVVPQPQDLVAKATIERKSERVEKKELPEKAVTENNKEQDATVEHATETIAIQQWEAVQVEVKKLVAEQTTALNNSVANLHVTSVVPSAYNQTEGPEEPAVTDGTEKRNQRTSAKGFLRKVSRFIERRTGIGTVNADDELLVGAVALKLN